MPRLRKGNPKIDAMNEEELARYYQEHKGDVSLWEPKPVKIRVRRGGPSTLFSLRLAPEELEEIRDAAGGNVSDFIRTAALERARRGKERGMQVEAKLEGMGITLPTPPAPMANYIGAVRVDKLLFVSGHGPTRDGDHLRGKVGRDLTVEQGYEAARLTMINLLATVKAAVGDLDQVERVVKLLGMVNAPEGFTQTPAVINGASDLLVELYGEKGKHARSAVGLAALPANIPVEIEMIVQLK